MKAGDLVALQKACDEIIAASIQRYELDKKFGPYHFKLDLREVLSRERLGQAPVSFAQGYLEFLNMRPVYSDMLGGFSVTVDLQDCVLNSAQAQQFNRASCQQPLHATL